MDFAIVRAVDSGTNTFLYSWKRYGSDKTDHGSEERAQELTGCSNRLWGLVDEDNLTHIYISESIGRLTTMALEGCAGIEKVYEENGVSVWDLVISR